ncbi:MAG: tail fiber domain-containing protein, partial [Terrimicrobiaceae bacterium]
SGYSGSGVSGYSGSGTSGYSGPSGFSGYSGAGGSAAPAIPITDDTTTDANRYILLGDIVSGNLTTINVSSTKLTFNPSTGTVGATNFTSTSDISLKENFSEITDALEIIESLRGVTFNWKDNKHKAYGFIAQDVEKILPDVVFEAEDVKSISYTQIIPILVQAVKELKVEIVKNRQ